MKHLNNTTNTNSFLEVLDPMAKKSELIQIEDESSLIEATELLTNLNMVSDKMTELKEQVTRPLNEALKAERLRWKPYEDIYNNAIAVIRTKISAYQTLKMALQREQMQKAVDSIKSGENSLENAIMLADQVNVTKKIVTESGASLTFREKDTLKITSLSKIPRKYLIPDEDKILKDLKEGKKIAGCEIEVIQVPHNKR